MTNTVAGFFAAIFVLVLLSRNREERRDWTAWMKEDGTEPKLLAILVASQCFD
jgi:hypothetical protein